MSTPPSWDCARQGATAVRLPPGGGRQPPAPPGGRGGRRQWVDGRACSDVRSRPALRPVAWPSLRRPPWALAGGIVRVAVARPGGAAAHVDPARNGRRPCVVARAARPPRRHAGRRPPRRRPRAGRHAQRPPVATASRARRRVRQVVDYAQGARAAADQLLADLRQCSGAPRRRRRDRAGAGAHRAGRRRRRARSVAPTRS
jgi:hypothetical protein